MNKKAKTGGLLLALGLPLAGGALAAAAAGDGISRFRSLYMPLLTPPGWVFPAVWTALYALMGIASWMVYASPASPPRKKRALSVYAGQLLVNFFWPLLFFAWGLYTAAFVWLLLLGLAAFACYTFFRYISPGAGRLLLPYLLWLAFAAYLNLGAALLN